MLACQKCGKGQCPNCMAAEGVPDEEAGSHGEGADDVHSVCFLLRICYFPELFYYGCAYLFFPEHMVVFVSILFRSLKV